MDIFIQVYGQGVSHTLGVSRGEFAVQRDRHMRFLNCVKPLCHS